MDSTPFLSPLHLIHTFCFHSYSPLLLSCSDTYLHSLFIDNLFVHTPLLYLHLTPHQTLTFHRHFPRTHLHTSTPHHHAAPQHTFPHWHWPLSSTMHLHLHTHIPTAAHLHTIIYTPTHYTRTHTRTHSHDKLTSAYSHTHTHSHINTGTYTFVFWSPKLCLIHLWWRV